MSTTKSAAFTGCVFF